MDMRLRASSTGLYTYPDVAVVCGKPAFADDQNDTLLNPTVIIEVLSESRRDYDRGRKFQHYRTVPPLMEYLAIAQDAIHIEQWTRQPDQRWLLTEAATAPRFPCNPLALSFRCPRSIPKSVCPARSGLPA